MSVLHYDDSDDDSDDDNTHQKVSSHSPVLIGTMTSAPSTELRSDQIRSDQIRSDQMGDVG